MARGGSPFGLLGAAPALWSILFVAAPLLIVLLVSLTSQSAFEALLSRQPSPAEDWPSFRAYGIVLGDPLYRRAALSAVWIAGLSACLAVAIAYPLAYVISQLREPLRGFLAGAVMLPFWTSFLLRVYAFAVLLGVNGPFSQLVRALGMTPPALLHTDGAAILGVAYSYLPFAFLPIFAGLSNLDRQLLEAAADLGAGPFARFFRVVLPLSAPGLIAGFFLVFIPALGEYVVPDLLGGPNTLTLGRSLWTEVFGNRDWPVAAALAVLLLAAAALVGLVPSLWAGRRR